jgi:hypothetical protein
MKVLKVSVKDTRDVPGFIGTMRDVRVSVMDSDDPRTSYYDKASTISDVTNKASQLQQYGAILQMLKEANREVEK